MIPRPLSLLLLTLLPFAAMAANPLASPPKCREAREADLDGDPVKAAKLQMQCIAGSKQKGWLLGDEYRSLGYYHRDSGQHESALAAFDRAIALYPMPNELLLVNRGRAHLALGHLDAAHADFDQALGIGVRSQFQLRLPSIVSD